MLLKELFEVPPHWLGVAGALRSCKPDFEAVKTLLELTAVEDGMLGCGRIRWSFVDGANTVVLICKISRTCRLLRNSL